MPKSLQWRSLRDPFRRKSGNFTKMKSGTEKLICKKDEECGFKTISHGHVSERHRTNLKNGMLILVQNENQDRIFKKIKIFPSGTTEELENNIAPTLT